MKKLLLFSLGIGVGFLLADRISRTQRGKELFDDLSQHLDDLSDSFVSGFKDRQAELRSVLDDLETDLKTTEK